MQFRQTDRIHLRHRKNRGLSVMLYAWREYAADPAHPVTQDAFRHGLAGVSQRCINGTLNHTEPSIRDEILTGLVAYKGGEAQISTSMRIPVEIRVIAGSRWRRHQEVRK